MTKNKITGYVSAGGKSEHVLVAEKALGHDLPNGAEVHHINRDRADNINTNLVVCQDRTYHRLLHRREAALKITGNVNWLRCIYCKEYDDPSNLVVFNQPYGAGKVTERARHNACASKYMRELKARWKNSHSQKQLEVD